MRGHLILLRCEAIDSRRLFSISSLLEGLVDLRRALHILIVRLVIHISHIDSFIPLLVDEDIGFNVTDALAVYLSLHLEGLAEEVQQKIPLDVRIQRISDSREDHKTAEEVDQNGIHNGILLQRLKYARLPLTKQSKELHDQTLSLRVIEYTGVIVGSEDELKGRIVDDLLDLPNVQIIVDIIELEAKFEVLIVKDPNLCLWIIFEDLDYSSGIDEVGLEEGGQHACVGEDLAVSLEALQRSHVSIISTRHHTRIHIDFTISSGR